MYPPEQVFDPLYVLVIVIVVRLTCAVPVALDEQPDDIMLPVGRFIVKVMSSPDMMPEKAPGPRPCMPEPEKLIGPVTMDPFCVSCHVIVPMSICPIMLPAPSELLESNPVPDQIPAIDADGVTPDGAVEELPPQAAANDAKRTVANAFFIVPLCVCRIHRAMSDSADVSRHSPMKHRSCQLQTVENASDSG